MSKASFFQRFAAWSIDWAKPTLRERAILYTLYFLGSIAGGLASAVFGCVVNNVNSYKISPNRWR